jgi:hypothetical protein
MGKDKVDLAILENMNAMEPDNQQFIEEISATASGEASLSMDIEKIKKKWSENKFDVMEYRGSKDKFIL